jgi:Asp-tRNA(Asn)/Glu-tRNA(Gln) amidotransferase C subunit
MDISDLVKIIAKMSGMNQKEREQLEKFIEQFDEIDEIDSLSDLEDIDFSNLEDFDLDQFDIDGLGNRPGKRSAEDFRQDPPKKPDERVQDQVDVKISDDEDEPYHGHTWVEVEERFESFVDIPEEAKNSNIDITLRESSVYVSTPIDKELETAQLPSTVEKLDAEVTDGGRLLVQVW